MTRTTNDSVSRTAVGAGPGRPLLLLLVAASGLATLLGNSTGLASAPPLTDLGAWPEWAQAHAPLDVAAGLVRVGLLGMLTYLVVIALAHVLAALSPGRRMCSIVERATPRLLAALLAGSVLGATPAVGAVAGNAIDRPVDIGPGAGATMQVIDDDEPRTRLPWAGAPKDRPPAVTAPGTAPPSTTPNPNPNPTPTPTPTQPMILSAQLESTYLVEAGDHLWGIAERQLRAHGVEDTALLVQYWHQLIEVNRDRLVDPENPDLIHPGQELELPPMP